MKAQIVKTAGWMDDNDEMRFCTCLIKRLCLGIRSALKVMKMQAVIALGSNQGDSNTILRSAIEDIARLPHTLLTKTSTFIRTKPWGYLDQPDFLNAVILVDTQLDAYNLFDELSALEQKYKRVRLFKNGPRTLDLDVILYGDTVSHDPKLTLPHPRAQERLFVIEPLHEIAPDLVFPDTLRTVQEVYASLKQQQDQP